AEKPEMLPLMAQLTLWGVRGFRVGRDIEGMLEQSIAQMQQEGPPQKPPSPEEQKAKIEQDKMQQEMTLAQQKAEGEQQARQQELAAKDQERQQEYDFKQREFEQKLQFQEREF